MPIQVLSERVIAQIAAGEVVERPSSVVKELLENALDAGASHITIETSEGGRKLIRISDDGSGMMADDLPLAIVRHATSKLRQIEDLERIHTLGFRGEALASIVAVSRSTITTRHRNDTVGYELRIEGGEIHSQKAIGAPAGTIIKVENLFFNTPARLKFLKAEATEKRLIANTVMNYAIAYPAVRFILIQDGHEAFRSTGNGQLGDVVVNVFGLDAFKQMIAIQAEDHLRRAGDSIRVWGYSSLPELNRNDRSRIILFVNGRSIQDGGLSYAIAQAYQALLPKGRYPLAVVLIEAPSDFVDVNVHPAKAEVRFQDPNAVFVAVQRAVREALVRVTSLERLRDASLPSTKPPTLGNPNAWASPSQSPLSNFKLPDATPSARPSRRETLDDEIDLSHIPEGRGQPSKPRTLPMLRVVGQVGAAYIIAEGPAGLYLIDQHAAHHRVLYDEAQSLLQAEAGRLPSFNLSGLSITLSPPAAQSAHKASASLVRLGFAIEDFGPTTLMLRAIPDLARHINAAELFRSLLEGTSGLTEDMLLIRLTQQAAIKQGQLLNHEEMQQIIRKLERCPQPYASPLDHPTFIHMSAEQLAREFTRRNP